MPVVRASDLRREPCGRGVEFSARVDGPSLGWRGQRLWFRVPTGSAPLDTHGDPFAVALLLPAMAAGADLHIDAPVSPALLDTLARVQTLVASWNARNPWGWMRPVELSAAGSRCPPPGPDRTGLFFTGGVDSLYSLVNARADIGHDIDTLLFVEGFDVPLDAAPLAEDVGAHLRAISETTSCPLVTVQTNLRQLTDPVISWEMLHGAALAAVGHLLGGTVQRWVLSSADAYLSNEAYGTSADLDPLWSRPDLTFLTAGLTLDRMTKLTALAQHPLAHEHLIVCWQRRELALNCGRCAKCVRTALQLQVIDALAHFRTLPRAIGPSDVTRILAEPAHRIFLWEDLLARLRCRPDGGALAVSVAHLIARSHRAGRWPRPWDMATRLGRRCAREWLRRRIQARLPVALRRRLLPLYRRGRV